VAPTTGKIETEETGVTCPTSGTTTANHFIETKILIKLNYNSLHYLFKIHAGCLFLEEKVSSPGLGVTGTAE
jgi:hypothetical protein